MIGGKPVSLVAAQRMLEDVREGDTVILIDQFGYVPNLPYGETDGPLGVASLARAVRFGLKGLPVLVTGHRDMDASRQTTKAAGLNVMPYAEANRFRGPLAAEILFPVADDAESRKVAARILDECAPKAVVAVEASW
jgi:hypothetical protein